MSEFKTAVSVVEDGRVVIRGYSHAEIMERLRYAEATFLTLVGRLPTPAETRLVDAMLTSLLDHGFVERRRPVPTVEEVLRAKRLEEPSVPDFIVIGSHQKVGEAIELMQQYSISQLPVVRDGASESLADVVGSLQDRDLLDRVFKNPDALHEDVATAMQPPLATIDIAQSLDEVFGTLTGRTNAIVVAQQGRPIGVLTRADLLEYLAHKRESSG